MNKINNTGHWTIKNGVIFDCNTIGFIYVIVNTINHKKYIGCKQMYSKSKKETSWRSYTGSSTQLNNDIEQYNKKNFKFYIIDVAYSKSELKFKELLYQIANNVLFREDFYNGIINVRLSKIKGISEVKIDNYVISWLEC